MDKAIVIAVIDALASLTVLIASHYLSPYDTDFVVQMVAVLQPLAIILAGAFAYQEHAERERIVKLTAEAVKGLSLPPKQVISMYKEAL